MGKLPQMYGKKRQGPIIAGPLGSAMKFRPPGKKYLRACLNFLAKIVVLANKVCQKGDFP